MGGEWHFRVLKDTDATKPEERLKLGEYQARLMDIRSKMGKELKKSARKHHYTVQWSSTDVVAETNIFCKFTYICKRNCQHGVYGTDRVPTPWTSWTPRGKMRKPVQIRSTAWWTLFWNPSIVPDEDVGSDIYARCAPYAMSLLSVPIQKQLAIEFPKHFQLYLADDIGGYGGRSEQYWGGVIPAYAINNTVDTDSDDEYRDDLNLWTFFTDQKILITRACNASFHGHSSCEVSRP